MLAVSRALMLRPRLLLLDEPSFGLAPRIVQELFQILREINHKEGTSMLLVEQNAALALKLAVLALIKEKKSEAPILLLDDVLSELDDSRQQLLLSSIRGCQAFLTCTSLAALRDRELFDELTVFRVQDGDITPAEWESLP